MQQNIIKLNTKLKNIKCSNPLIQQHDNLHQTSIYSIKLAVKKQTFFNAKQINIKIILNNYNFEFGIRRRDTVKLRVAQLVVHPPPI